MATKQAPTKKFKKGQKVYWTSQAAGSSKTKHGTIVAVVPGGTDPRRVVHELPAKLKNKLTEGSFYGYGTGRDHDSYLVAVEGKTKTQLYWPLVSKLLASTENPQTTTVDKRRVAAKKK